MDEYNYPNNSNANPDWARWGNGTRLEASDGRTFVKGPHDIFWRDEATGKVYTAHEIGKLRVKELKVVSPQTDEVVYTMPDEDSPQVVS